MVDHVTEKLAVLNGEESEGETSGHQIEGEGHHVGQTYRIHLWEAHHNDLFEISFCEDGLNWADMDGHHPQKLVETVAVGSCGLSKMDAGTGHQEIQHPQMQALPGERTMDPEEQEWNRLDAQMRRVMIECLHH